MKGLFIFITIWFAFKIVMLGILFCNIQTCTLYYIGNDVLIIGFIYYSLTFFSNKLMFIFTFGCFFYSLFEFVIDTLHYIFNVGNVEDVTFVIYGVLSFKR